MQSAADEIFRLVPEGSLPPGHAVVLVESGGDVRYLIDESAPMTTVVAELNGLATHLVRHGLWVPQAESASPRRLRHVG